jgi:hypothetical protein
MEKTMTIFWLVVFGLVTNYLADFVTRWFLDTAPSTLKLEPPSKALAKKWEELAAGMKVGLILGTWSAFFTLAHSGTKSR